MAVLTGLDRLLHEENLFTRLKGKQIGLLVNPTSVTQDLVHGIEALLAKGVEITRLFGPEHGVRAEAQDMEAVQETRDPLTGIACVSLYGHTFESLSPAREDLEELDLVICDIQDIGARYYTYVYTIGLMMEACGKAGVEVLILDRPNPINGLTIEGNLLKEDCRSFVGMQALPNRHGMTVGELARFFDTYCGWSCDFEVVKMKGWKRSMWFDDTGLPWVMPSPNMPTLDTAIVYPGQCLLEGTNLSEARGTTRPFELFGAPYCDATVLGEYLEGLSIPGVRYRLASFRPKFQKHANQTCKGLQIHVTDRAAFPSLSLSYGIIAAFLAIHPDEFAWREEAYEFVTDQLAIDLLFGDKAIRPQLEAGANPIELANSFRKELRPFLEARQKCLLYHD